MQQFLVAPLFPESTCEDFFLRLKFRVPLKWRSALDADNVARALIASTDYFPLYQVAFEGL